LTNTQYELSTLKREEEIIDVTKTIISLAMGRVFTNNKALSDWKTYDQWNAERRELILNNQGDKHRRDGWFRIYEFTQVEEAEKLIEAIIHFYADIPTVRFHYSQKLIVITTKGYSA